MNRVLDAIDALNNPTLNGRDYYPQGPSRVAIQLPRLPSKMPSIRVIVENELEFFNGWKYTEYRLHFE